MAETLKTDVDRGACAAEQETQPDPLGSVHTDNFPGLLDALGCSLFVTTYQAGRVIILRPDGQILARGLSMPHSPRWHAGQLWLLESGTGSLGIIDLEKGRYQPLVYLPGFTRGLDFAGRFAFVGLSQVRETAVFSGLPITETNERISGIYVVDLETLQVAAYLQFDGSVHEIFAVRVLPNFRFPELVVDDVELLTNAFVLPDPNRSGCIAPSERPKN